MHLLISFSVMHRLTDCPLFLVCKLKMQFLVDFLGDSGAHAHCRSTCRPSLGRLCLIVEVDWRCTLLQEFVFRVAFRHVELPVLNFEVEVWCFILSSCVILGQGVQKIEQAYSWDRLPAEKHMTGSLYLSAIWKCQCGGVIGGQYLNLMVHLVNWLKWSSL